MKIAGIVLAAGMSTRMGAFKPLLCIDGKAMVVRVVETLQEAGGIDPIVVVTGHEAVRLKAVLEPGHTVRFVHNNDYEAGEMLSSVQTGLRAMPVDINTVVLALGDQPKVEAATVARLIAEFQRSNPPLVIPVFNGKRGHPVVLSTALIPEILSLPRGDTLKTVVHRHNADALQVQVDDPGVILDFDTPEDLRRVN